MEKPKKRPATTQGKKAEPVVMKKITALFTEAQRRKLREYAAREDTTLQAILVQGATEVLAKKGVKL